jgi:ComF family protein
LALPIEPGLRDRIRSIGRAALDLLLPLQCALCEAPVEQPGQLCAACFARTSFITAPCCARCGVPFAAEGQGGAMHLCPACRDAPPVYGEARAALRYDRQARQLILPFKHADRTELARVLAPQMARAGAALLRRAELLIPVPLHRGRLFHRRYNQAALLALALARLTGRAAMVDALLRVRPTVPLGEKSPDERAATVAGVFAVRPRRAAVLVGKRLLLIDDVMTSGATANACAAVLLAAGATAVDVLVAARVPDPRLQ